MILQKIEQLGIVPVLTVEDEEKVIKIVDAMTEGGIPSAEITFRTKNALLAIEKLSLKYPNMILGAGTVLTKEQVDDAINAGAKFVVSPGFNPKIVDYCLSKNITIIPGANNPTSIEMALEMGIKTIKFFPAESSGGINAIKELSEPYNELKFIPTGSGINLDNIANYLKFPKVSACGASFMATKEMIDNDDYEAITKMSALAMKKVFNFEFLHMGIGSEDEETAKRETAGLATLFNLDVKKGLTSYMIDDKIEIMKSNETNHIGFSTNNVERAVNYLKSKGINIVESSKKYENGILVFAYLEKEMAGNRIHIKKN